ncbi:DUF3703 domain-containing protein [Altererythrobacter ishigakiensis]|jgi:hypothetical protein|uniref:Uncharacterized protein DUF3703 n=1 Tax=Altererythrobacter ishigakiensis TaxID=476157 RepID=A0A562UME3_9SPHN|nr:DUF3703 domain-containing protein [Altererythrobacter ishigakiensis]TNE39141.1 MAG: DUF3703 domain-containing protein [Sphingomonadales bacterium]TWJ06790.1 uncharacterized protein DUF3703 [Altererythrobacter ishigakiensis]
MTNPNHARITAFLESEYASARNAANTGKIEDAWQHLERAHIVAQGMLVPHLYSHWRMLVLAAKTRDGREILGQLMRVALAPLGNLTGRLPIGNTGRSDVSAFAHMDIPDDLRAMLSMGQR